MVLINIVITLHGNEIKKTPVRFLSKVSKESFSVLKVVAAGPTKFPCASDYMSSHPRGWYDSEPLRENLKWRRSVTDSVLIVHVSAQWSKCYRYPAVFAVGKEQFCDVICSFLLKSPACT